MTMHRTSEQPLVRFAEENTRLRLSAAADAACANVNEGSATSAWRVIYGRGGVLRADLRFGGQKIGTEDEYEEEDYDENGDGDDGKMRARREGRPSTQLAAGSPVTCDETKAHSSFLSLSLCFPLPPFSVFLPLFLSLTLSLALSSPSPDVDVTVASFGRLLHDRRNLYTCFLSAVIIDVSYLIEFFSPFAFFFSLPTLSIELTIDSAT